MTDSRQSRTQETREAEEVHESYNNNWDNPGLLDTKNIPARDGFVQRWVRTKVKGEDDQSNVFRKINQDWKPRLKSSVPKGAFIPNIDFQGKDVIGIHGMILMERPQKQHEAQAKHIKEATNSQMSAVKKNIFNVHEAGSGMTQPAMRNNSSVSKGREPGFDDD